MQCHYNVSRYTFCNIFYSLENPIKLYMQRQPCKCVGMSTVAVEILQKFHYRFGVNVTRWKSMLCPLTSHVPASRVTKLDRSYPRRVGILWSCNDINGTERILRKPFSFHVIIIPYSANENNNKHNIQYLVTFNAPKFTVKWDCGNNNNCCLVGLKIE